MKKSDLKIIKQIQAEAWGKFGDKLFIMRPKAGVMLAVIDKALTTDRDKFDEAKLDKLQNIKDSGMLDGEEKVEDPEVAKEYEEYVGKRIAEEIEKGTLSKPEKALKKSKQHGNRTKNKIRSPYTTKD